MAFTRPLCWDAISNRAHCVSRQRRDGRRRARSQKFTHFKLFICGAQLNRGGRGGSWLAADAQSRTFTLIAWNVNTKNWHLCVRVCVWMPILVFERLKKKDGNRLGSRRLLAGTPTHTVKNSTALGDKQQPRVLWEWRRREGRREGGRAVIITCIKKKSDWQ